MIQEIKFSKPAPVKIDAYNSCLLLHYELSKKIYIKKIMDEVKKKINKKYIIWLTCQERSVDHKHLEDPLPFKVMHTHLYYSF